MTTHPTPGPIQASLNLHKANVHLVAADCEETTVEVRPTDPDDPSDVWAAEHTTVELSDSTLRVVAPEQRRPGDSESIDVAVRLPARSDLDVRGGAVRLRADGTLGDCEVDVGSGAVRLERVAGAILDAGSAEVAVIEAGGDVSVDAGSSRIRLDRVGGSVRIEAASGGVELGEVAGDVRVRTASGRISADRLGSSAEIAAASGAVHLGQLVRGRVSVETTAGDIVLGIGRGSAAWLDLRSTVGRVRNELDETGVPDSAEAQLEIRAVTKVGNITVRRSAPVGT